LFSLACILSIFVRYLPERTPDEEDAALQVPAVFVDHVGGYESDDEVEQPVGGGGLGGFRVVSAFMLQQLELARDGKRIVSYHGKTLCANF
jgi:hypothetical protein